MKIEMMSDETLPEARALVDRVFPHQTFIERLFFWTYARRGSWVARALMAIAGVSDFSEMWVVLDEEENVVGTSGLYRCRKDSDEALWLSWFCLAPEVRGEGQGGSLLDYSIDRARALGADYLRLYTTDRPGEAVAQHLYERRGLRTSYTRKRPGYTMIIRELSLCDRGD